MTGSKTDETKIIPPHGGYQKLKSHQMIEVLFDAIARPSNWQKIL
jgi:hypothetical protein